MIDEGQEKKIFPEGDSNFLHNSRTPAFMAEILLNVYVYKHNLRCKFFQKAFIKNFTHRYDLRIAVKSLLKNVPFLVQLKNWLFKDELAKTLERMEKCRTHEKMKECMYSLSAEETGKFLCLPVYFAYNTCFVMMLFPLDETADYMTDLEEIIKQKDEEADRKDPGRRDPEGVSVDEFPELAGKRAARERQRRDFENDGTISRIGGGDQEWTESR